VQSAIVFLIVAAVTFNAALAFANAQITPMTPGHVMAVEGLLLAAVAGLVLASGLSETDGASIALVVIFLLIAIGVSMANGALFPDMMRHVAIVALFSMLGLRAEFATLVRAAGLCSVLVLAVLALEAFALDLYVGWFQPANYYEATRGLENPSYNETGLFANALSFEDRFSFGLLGHRASSLFLEQVSLANYAAVMLVLLIGFWRRLSWRARVLQMVTVVAILITTDSRIGLILAAAALAGYFLFPRLPSYANIAVAPLLLILAALLMAGPEARLEDDIVGRLTLTMRTMAETDLPALLGMRAFEATAFADSGYTYVLYAGTLFGLLALWAFVALYIPQDRPGPKRCAYLLSLFVGSSLLVAGTSVFTIKVAAMLWLVAGVARRRPFEEEAVDAERTRPGADLQPRRRISRRHPGIAP